MTGHPAFETVGQAGNTEPAVDTGLVQDADDMGLHGLQADAEDVGDLLIALAEQHAGDDFEFPRLEAEMSRQRLCDIQRANTPVQFQRRQCEIAQGIPVESVDGKGALGPAPEQRQARNRVPVPVENQGDFVADVIFPQAGRKLLVLNGS